MNRNPATRSAPLVRQREVFLQPGEFFVGNASYRIRTLLGSCVSVTLWSPLRRVGAMSHFLLAERGRMRRPSEGLDGRYGDEALALMLERLARRHVRAAECEAKIFGGGEMFPERPGGSQISIGRRNGQAAREMLQARGIQVVSESLFGSGHRQILFDVASGHVWARQLPLNPEGVKIPRPPQPVNLPPPSSSSS